MKAVATLLLLATTSAHSLTLYPTEVNATVDKGSSFSVSFVVGNSNTAGNVLLIKSDDLTTTRDSDTILYNVSVAKNGQISLPVTFSPTSTKEFYICAAQSSPSLYLRSCARVQVTLK